MTDALEQKPLVLPKRMVSVEICGIEPNRGV